VKVDHGKEAVNLFDAEQAKEWNRRVAVENPVEGHDLVVESPPEGHGQEHWLEFHIDSGRELLVERAGHKVPVVVDPVEDDQAMELVCKVGIDLGSKLRMKTSNSSTKLSGQHWENGQFDLEDMLDE